MRIWSAPLLLLMVASTSPAQWTPQASGTMSRLRGLSVVDRDAAWASGGAGTCLRTIDGGMTWVTRAVPVASGLDFRDVHGVGASTAYLLSKGARAVRRVRCPDA
jgi:hypothetical protein